MSDLTHALQAIPTYRPFGGPSYATVQFKVAPSNGVTVTINGDVYTAGVDFSGATVPVRAAQALTAAIRSDIGTAFLNNLKQPIRPYCAIWYNDTVFLFATTPGSSGNGLTLATSNSGQVAISGANFAGGIDATQIVSIASSGAFTDNSGTVTAGGTSQQAAAANAGRKYLLIQNQSTDTLYVNFGTAAVVGQPSIALVPASGSGLGGGSLVFESSFVPNGTINILGASTGSKYLIKQA